ncbi:MAG TPA: hypothetical protein VIY51_06295 [Xanthobacteraceae bacterium]
MTEQTYSPNWNPERPLFGMQGLWRLAIWGGFATVALFVAVISAFSGTGAQRSAASVASGQQTSGLESVQPRVPAGDFRASPSNNAEETRHLSEAVRTLTADRDQLATRLAVLEHNLEGVTGSIKRDRAAAAASAPQQASPQAPAQNLAAAINAMPAPWAEAPATPAPSMPPITPAPVTPAPVTPAPVTHAPMTPAPLAPAPAASAPAAPTGPSKPEVTVVALKPPPAAPSGANEAVKSPASDAGNRAMAPASDPARMSVPSEPFPAPSGLGVDVGGAANFDGLRALWHSTKNNDPSLLDDFYPVVATRENGKTHAAELRLIIGPMPDAEAAAQLCVTLATAHQYCQPVAFEGQRLALGDAGKAAPAAAHHHGAGAPIVSGFKPVPAYPAGK